jgi:hypothetical protein
MAGIHVVQRHASVNEKKYMEFTVLPLLLHYDGTLHLADICHILKAFSTMRQIFTQYPDADHGALLTVAKESKRSCVSGILRQPEGIPEVKEECEEISGQDFRSLPSHSKQSHHQPRVILCLKEFKKHLSKCKLWHVNCHIFHRFKDSFRKLPT